MAESHTNLLLIQSVQRTGITLKLDDREASVLLAVLGSVGESALADNPIALIADAIKAQNVEVANVFVLGDIELVPAFADQLAADETPAASVKLSGGSVGGGMSDFLHRPVLTGNY